MNTRDYSRAFAAVIVVLCSFGAVVRAQAPSTETQTATTPGAASDSGYVDLARRGSGKLRQAINDYLKETGLRVGENPNGLWVQTGQVAVQGMGGAPGWGNNRKLAFVEAQLQAQAALVKSLSIKSTCITLRELFQDDSVLQPQFAEAKGFEERVQSKLEQLSEATIDKALKDLGETPAPIEKLESKRELYRKAVLRSSNQKAFSQVSGFYVLQCFEAVDEENPGKVSVGVVIGRRPNSLGWISLIAKGGGAQGVPRDKPGRSLAERVPQDPKVLYERFGVRVVTDETGQICLIAYGQDSPDVKKGMSPEEIESRIEAAETFAEQDAINALTEFLDASVAWQRRVDEGLRVGRTETSAKVDGVDVTRQDNFEDVIKKLNEKTVRWSSAYIKGVTPYYTWQGNHPEFGNPLVGCVLVWTPATATAAGRFGNSGTPGTGGGYKTTGPTPGVRRSQGEDVPNGNGGGEELRSAQPAPVDTPCDATEAIGVGMDRDNAIIQALENAVRQVCGAAITNTTATERRAETSIADIKLNEVCDEMRATFTSTALLKQDINVRTKGYVTDYRILSEDVEPDGRRIRVRICARVPSFDPKNPRPGAKPTLIVLTPTSRNRGYTILGDRVDSDVLARTLETELTRDLFKQRAFTILERERLAAILGEQVLISSGLTAIREQAKIGKLSAGDSVLVTEIEDVVANQNERVIQLTGARIVKRNASMKINWRIVSVGTGEVLDQDTVAISFDDDGFRQLSARNPGAPVPTVLMAEAVSRMIPDLATRAAPLRISQVVAGKIFLNKGRTSISPGQAFDVFRQGAELRDPNTGASLGRADTKVGTIKVERTENEFSIATVVSGDVTSDDVGSLCR